MDNEKRLPRTYKAKDTPYKRAKRKSAKPLATFVEDFINAVSEDRKIFFDDELVHSPKIKSKQ